MNRKIDLVRKLQAAGKISQEQAEMFIAKLHDGKKGAGSMPVRAGILLSVTGVIAVIVVAAVLLHAPGSRAKTPGIPDVNQPGASQDCFTDTKDDRQCRFVELPGDSVVRQGEMLVMMAGKKLSLPLIHTDVSGTIDGFCARVAVTQKFINPGNSTIEALYTFPLPENAAVDSMFMEIGCRRIAGVIRERGEARAIYEQARRDGKTASLLEQERPNIFTQSVANILKNDTILITISYVQELTYRNGKYHFNFPMVIGPRYIPGHPARVSDRGTENPTSQVPDADRITPPLVAPEFRSGHELSLRLAVNAGTPLSEVNCPSHKTAEQVNPDGTWIISIAPNDQIPNKDFVLDYGVAKKEFNTIVLTHRSADTGFFQLILVPKLSFQEKEVFPRELVFVVDNSGSMQGFPVEKCKEIMALCLKKMRADDVFRLITFANETQTLSADPLTANSENQKRALEFVDRMSGSGGTEMMGAINEIFNAPPLEGRKRLVFFLTDGMIGNDQAIIASIRDRSGAARVFSMGVGSSPNRYLIESMAYAGRGCAFFIRQDGDAFRAMQEFYDLVDAPVLTDISVHCTGVEIFDLLPQRIPDLFAAQPLVITGRYKDPGRGVLRIEGALARGTTYTEKISLEFPAQEPAQAVLATLWARRKIAEYDLFGGGLLGDQAFTPDRIKERITVLGLTYRVMTQFTSFVAVDKQVRNKSGKWVPVEQAVDLPEGVSPASQPGYRYTGEELRTRCARMGVGGISAGQSGRICSPVYGRSIDAVKGGMMYMKTCEEAPGGYGSGFGGTGAETGKTLARPSLDLSSVTILKGGRSKQSVLRVVMQNLASLRYAYNKRLRDKPDVQGTVTVKFKIDYAGKVISCEIVQTTMNDPELENAIKTRIQRWVFEGVTNKDDVTEVVYPLVFSK
jgi:Ca-activated chloride channel family protein